MNCSGVCRICPDWGGGGGEEEALTQMSSIGVPGGEAHWNLMNRQLSVLWLPV